MAEIKKSLREIAATTPKAPPLESSIVKSCLDYLNEFSSTEFQKRHGARTRSGEPDITGCFAGLHWEIEVKRPGRKPTKRQLSRMRKWSQAGAVVCWVNSLKGLQKIVDFWRMQGVEPIPIHENNDFDGRNYAHNLI